MAKSNGASIIDCFATLERLLQELDRRFESLLGEFSEEYLERVRHGMQSWMSAGKEGNFKWAMFHFQKH